VGGVDKYGALRYGTRTNVEAQAHDAIKQMNGGWLIIAAGCTFRLSVPDNNLITTRRAVDTVSLK